MLFEDADQERSERRDKIESLCIERTEGTTGRGRSPSRLLVPERLASLCNNLRVLSL